MNSFCTLQNGNHHMDKIMSLSFCWKTINPEFLPRGHHHHVIPISQKLTTMHCHLWFSTNKMQNWRQPWKVWSRYIFVDLFDISLKLLWFQIVLFVVLCIVISLRVCAHIMCMPMCATKSLGKLYTLYCNCSLLFWVALLFFFFFLFLCF